MSDEFKIRQPAPKASVINRWLVVGVVLVIVLLTFYLMLTPSSKPVKKSTMPGVSASDLQTNPEIEKLPGGYDQADLVKQYMPSEKDNTYDELLRAQHDLEAQLAALRSSPPQRFDSDTSGARKSDLFFYDSKPSPTLFKTEEISKTLAANVPNNSYNQQNMQQQKINFVNDLSADGDVYNKYHMIKPQSPYEVQAGTIISASLLTAVNTTLPGDIIAQVKNNVYDSVRGHFLLIPKGSKLLGKYDSAIAYGQERILIVFNRIIRPDGSSIQLSNFTGSDIFGGSGFEANVDNHWGKVLGAATISTMLSIGAGIAADRNQGNSTYYPNTVSNGIVGASTAISDVGQQITGKAIDVQPTLTMPAGFVFNVIVNKDMILEPYVTPM